MGKEEFQVKNRQFSERTARVGKVNYISLLAMTTVELFLIFAFVVQLTVMKNASKLIIMVPLILLILGIVANWGSYLKNKDSERLRYVMMIPFILAYAWLNLSGGAVFVLLYILPVLFILILFRDKAYSRIFSLIAGAIAVTRLVLDLMKDGGTDDTTVIIVVMMVLLCLVYFFLATHLYKRFDHDTVHTMRDEQKMQQLMLRDILEIIAETQEEVHNVAALMETLESSTEVVNHSLQEITTGTQSTAESIQEQTVMTENIRTAVQKADEGAVAMAEDSMSAARALKESTNRMQLMKQNAEMIEASAGDVVEVRSLKEKAEEVSSITQVIFSISSQTNLLALNASIESARAGEAGRGFSVVADQIRQLAEQTKQSTEQISQIAQQLNAEAETASGYVMKSVDATSEQKELIIQNVSEIENVYNGVNSSARKAQELTGEINRLLTANNKIVESIGQLSAVSEEVTANTQQAGELSDSNMRDLFEAAKKVQEIRETVQQLKKYEAVIKKAEA